jgi:hypothetical protein
MPEATTLPMVAEFDDFVGRPAVPRTQLTCAKLIATARCRTSLIPALSCRSCRPNAPFAQLARLSRTRIRDETREVR